MKIPEAKLVFQKWSEEIIDIWFGSGKLSDALIKPAIKVILRNNINKADTILNLFTDSNGDLDINGLLDKYMKELIPEDGITIDPKELFGDNFFSSIISPKLLEKSDILKLKTMIHNGL